jgi:hypothetical protein
MKVKRALPEALVEGEAEAESLLNIFFNTLIRDLLTVLIRICLISISWGGVRLSRLGT